MSSPLLPSTQYEVQDYIGRGHSAEVYRAIRVDHSLGLQQTVALKILNDKTLVDELRREFESLAQIRSRYCVQLFGFENWQNRPTLVLEYVDGVDLETLHHEGLEESEITELLRQIQCGLLDLSEQGLFHGDLSLRNVLVDKSGTVRLVDYGHANYSEDHMSVTVDYVAPEIFKMQKPNLKSDLFSLARLEQFLRLSGSATAILFYQNLNEDPEQRKLLQLEENMAARESIKKRVLEMKLRQLSRRASTLRIIFGASNKTKIVQQLSIAAIVCLTFILPQSQSSTIPHLQHKIVARPLEPAKSKIVLAQPVNLSIRTKNWMQVEINGQNLGYTPVLTKISPGPIHIRWQGAKSRGQRTLTLLEGQNKVLSDSFFR